jgi:hypothetical protein
MVGLTRSEEKSLKAVLRRVYENLDGLKDETPARKNRAVETARPSSKAKNQSVAKQ